MLAWSSVVHSGAALRLAQFAALWATFGTKLHRISLRRRAGRIIAKLPPLAVGFLPRLTGWRIVCRVERNKAMLGMIGGLRSMPLLGHGETVTGMHGR